MTAYAWDESACAHLLRRAAFGATTEQVRDAHSRGLEATVDDLLLQDASSDDVPKEVTDIVTLRGWWLHRMVTTPRPLGERLALFWHQHFATGHYKVKSLAAMHAQNHAFRRLGAGRFHELLRVISGGPAMMIWLDNWLNVKGRPNENFARELLELFTLGVFGRDRRPNYDEREVEEVARTFTGWGLSNDRARFRFHEQLHDDGDKFIRGETRRWTGEEVLEKLADDPACARRVAAQLFRFFAGPIDLDDPALDPLQEIYLEHDGEVRPVLRHLFTCDAFFHPSRRLALVKSPTDFLVGALRTLPAKPRPTTACFAALGHAVAALGQALLDPGTVFGWPGGETWVGSTGLRARRSFARLIVDPSPANQDAIGVDLHAAFDAHRDRPTPTPGEVVDRLCDRLGPLELGDESRAALASYLERSVGTPFLLDGVAIDRHGRSVVALALSTAEYQRM